MNLADFAKGLLAHWLEIILAIWMTAMFSERLLVDLATMIVPKRDHAWKRIREALGYTSLILMTIVSLSVFSVSLTLNQSSIEFLLHRAQDAGRRFLQAALDPYVLAFLVLFSLLTWLTRHLRDRSSIWTVIRDWWRDEGKRFLGEHMKVFLGFGAALVMAALFRWILLQFPADPRIKEIVSSWATTSCFIGANTFVFVLLYRVVFRGAISEDCAKWFWKGFAKDTAIYTLTAAYIGNGMLRYLRTLPHLSLADRWASYALFAAFTLFAAIAGSTMEYFYIQSYSKSGHTLEDEYKDDQARSIMRTHLYIRLIGLFWLPLIAWFSYLLVIVARLPA
jgi:hypothetical protein